MHGWRITEGGEAIFVGFGNGSREELTSKLRLEGGARWRKTWGRRFQAKGPAKAKAQVWTRTFGQ